MTIHVNKVRSAVENVLGNRTESDLKTAKLKKTLEKYASKMPAEKEALYRDLLRMDSSNRMKNLENLHGLSQQKESPEKMRSLIFAISKQRKLKWHNLGHWLFALTVKQLRQLAAVVRGEAPTEVRNAKKADLVWYIAEGRVEDRDRPEKLGEVYSNALEVSQWDGLEDAESVEYQKGHDLAKAKKKTRRTVRREKSSKEDSPEPQSEEKTTKKASTSNASSKLDEALNTIREIAEGGTSEEAVKEAAREAAREEVRSDASKDYIHNVVDQRVEEKLADVSLNLA